MDDAGIWHQRNGHGAGGVARWSGEPTHVRQDTAAAIAARSDPSHVQVQEEVQVSDIGQQEMDPISDGGAVLELVEIKAT